MNFTTALCGLYSDKSMYAITTKGSLCHPMSSILYLFFFLDGDSPCVKGTVHPEMKMKNPLSRVKFLRPQKISGAPQQSSVAAFS